MSNELQKYEVVSCEFSEQLKQYLAVLEWAKKEIERSYEKLGIKEEHLGIPQPKQLKQ